MNETEAKAVRAWVLHPDIQTAEGRRAAVPALEEAVALAGALGDLDIVGSEIVRLPKAHPGMLFGKGKLRELGERFSADNVDLVLVDGPVTPVQQRNLEKAWKVKLLDRTGLILEIFADRARTREGVLQVELAALSYQRTRLVRAWTHLERQRGGLGFVGGPGETQIEADRRAIDDAITRIRRQLAKVSKTRALHRAARARVPFPVVALVGYTNSGKSTLFNRLTGAGVLAEDMLFATLDPTMRSIELPTGAKVILSDTVGFISHLPTQLVAAFRATLEEVLSADLIVHMRDISHPDSASQAADVEAILEELGVSADTGRLEVWNKIDRLDPDDRSSIVKTAERENGVIAISALTGAGVEELLDEIGARLQDARQEREIFLDFSQGRKRAWLFEQGVVENEVQEEQGYRLTVRWTARQQKNFRDI